ncbi:MAG: sugar phosphate isomerase/epimerase [Elusimicrobia bacterium]|nr:sugar phosphate isomerase/epimerase [Elusimicrobiota bacterium]
MDIGISTGLFYTHKVWDLLSLIKKAGFEIVELWNGGKEWGAETHFDHHDHKQVKALQDALWDQQIRGLTMHGPFGISCDISVPDEKVRKKAIDEIGLAIETAAKIGAKIVIVHSGNMLTNSQDGFEKNRRIETSIQSLKIISEIAQKKNVRLALENLLGGMVAGEAWQLEQIIEALDKDVVGVCVDVSHASLGKELDKILKTFSSRIIAVHISDNHGKMDDHLIPGEGTLDFVKIARKLKEINYGGVFTLEILGEAVKRKPEEVLKAARQIALKIMKQAGV